ncbi:putative ABC transport system ATP-binding protein [Eubacterium ruminantium]|uniref:Putative ABC transport system ATP-binding protein n=1 Tax=Eubacterium ruminantium TaxID=42322 RepID=A0A1T4PQ16_9FIRM|nr:MULTISPECIES: ABC transporter ATP-binding protein [Eubacterium]MCR5367097.1 ABC transporter ATP-binding protein [Eubacterium sp.]SCW61444.1 putative ABC transport system ATP-binding protein [Eubacterium ruminantium]SDN18637.1 putative ABC transport system ATP-binding protein [Eubacterium ruminantium]SJZ93401.1 putative ABC transport system ATP-binding protein [Eubacterium ruminantium]
MAALKVKDLCKTYEVNKRQINVLKNVSFNIDDGEMVAIMGPSGSGKSTLLYSVSGMDRATAGSVKFDNEEIADMSEKNLADYRLVKMGFIFQQMNMLKNLTVYDNIILPGYEAGGKKNRKIVDERAKELMRKMEISEIADNDITEISGGQLQRACICRSLINNPGILFADEPTGALNRNSSEEVMRMMIKLNSEGMTIMMVTHDMKSAAKCSRILYIVDGNIKGELELGKVESPKGDITEAEMKKREKTVNNWLVEMGW